MRFLKRVFSFLFRYGLVVGLTLFYTVVSALVANKTGGASPKEIYQDFRDLIASRKERSEPV